MLTDAEWHVEAKEIGDRLPAITKALSARFGPSSPLREVDEQSVNSDSHPRVADGRG
jgi:hypothetical protein